MKELNIIEAMCIVHSGFSKEDEREIFNNASDIVVKEARRLKLINQKELIEKELEQNSDKMYSEDEVKSITIEMVNWALDNIGSPNPQSHKKFYEVIAKFKNK